MENNTKVLLNIVAMVALLLLVSCSTRTDEIAFTGGGEGNNALLLNPSSTVVCYTGSMNDSACYDDVVKMQRENGNVSRLVNGVVFAPWMDSSTACGVVNIKNGSSCNIATGGLNFTQYCQVSDEHSVQAINLATSNNITMWDGIYNFLNNSQSFSVFGRLPGWKCVVNETAGTWNCSRSGINGNGDSASDADARYILSTYAASVNPTFPSANQTLYRALGDALTADFVRYDLRYQCVNGTLGNGVICWWQGSGGNASNGGFAFGDFGYSGYNQDSILALYAAANSTGNMSYIAIAQNLTQGYLQMSNWTGASFRVPPGRSWKIYLGTVGGLTNVPIANCTNTCNPDVWDSADAVRAFAWGEAQLVATNFTNIPLLNMTTYLSQWNTVALSNNNNSVPLTYHSNGTFSSSNQSGYFAQGLQSQALSYANQTKYKESLKNALAHISASTRTPDSTTCFGTYNEAPMMRSLAFGIGRFNAAYTRSTAVNITENAFNGSMNVTVYSPTNGTVLTQNSTYFNVTVWNLNVSSSISSSNATRAYCTFSGSSDTCNASGGTLNTSTLVYESLANFQTWTFGPFNQSANQWPWYNITAKYYWVNASNDKIYPQETPSGTTFAPHPIIDIASGKLRIREEPGFAKTVTDKNNSWVTWSVIVNKTGNFTRFYNGSANWTNTTTVVNWVDGNYLRIALGGQKGMVRITNLTFQIRPEDAPNITTPGNSTMNVTLYWANGTIIYQQNGTTNGTNIGYNITYQGNGNYSWYITIRSNDGVVNYSGLNYSVETPTYVSAPTFNVTNDSITNSSFRVVSMANQTANMTVKYGTTVNLGSVLDNTTVAQNDTLNITGLTSSTLYYYNVTRCSSSMCNTTGPYSVTTSTTPFTGGDYSLCQGILSLYWKANISLGSYDPKTKTYNQSTILPINNSVCGWTYKLNNTDSSARTFTFSTNYTNANGNLTMFVNGSQFNASSSKAIVVPAGLVYFVNVSINLTRWPVLQAEPPSNVTIVVS